jgi:hypothetical protein
MKASLKNLNAEAYARLVKNAMQPQLGCDKPGAPAALAMQRQLVDMQSDLMALLPSNPEFSLDELSVTLEGKKALLSYAVGAQGVTAEELKAGFQPGLMQKVKLNAMVETSTGFLQELAKVFKQPPQMMDAMVAQGVDRGFIRQEGQSLKATIELAKAMGARVIAAASTAEKLATCRAQGADEVINYREQNLRDEVKRLTGGRGVDVVMDPVGGDYAEQALRSMAWRGRYLVVGFTDGQIPRLPLNLVLLKGCAIVGVFWGDFIRREPAAAAQDLHDLVAMYRDKRIEPLISGRYTLQDAPQAIAALAERRAQGKLIVLP